MRLENLIFGWVTGHAYGVAGAAMSSLIAILVGIVWLTVYFLEKDAYLRFVTADWGPRFDIWRRVLGKRLNFETSPELQPAATSVETDPEAISY